VIPAVRFINRHVQGDRGHLAQLLTTVPQLRERPQWLEFQLVNAEQIEDSPWASGLGLKAIRPRPATLPPLPGGAVSRQPSEL
jgi:hypothetical protein